MRRRALALFTVLLALVLMAAACSDDDGGDADGDSDDTAAESSTTAPTTTATLPDDAVAITGVSVTEVVFGDDGHVTITNEGTEEVTVDGLWLCNRPAYTPLTGTIAAGGTLEVAASELGGLVIEGGEAALYTSDSFDDSEAIIDYVQWGAGGGREAVAVEAGLWVAGGVVEPDAEFGAIERFDIAGGPDGWE